MEIQLIMEAFLVIQSPGSVHQGSMYSLYVGRMVMWSRVQVGVGRFSLDLMTKGTKSSPLDVSVKKREVVKPLHLNDELYIPVKFIEMI